MSVVNYETGEIVEQRHSEALREAIASLGGICVVPRPDCIIWMGDLSRGYAKAVVGGVKKRAHRVVWERVNGPIPDDLTIDHLCRVRSCLNTDHMELVTAAENARRMQAGKARATHCKRGHEFTPENTYTKPSDGHRTCLTCMRAREAARPKRRHRSRKSAPA